MALIQQRDFSEHIAQTLQLAGASPLMARLFAARSVTNAQELHEQLSSLLPFQELKNCEAAAARLADAIEQHERILIVADYDADGATACSIAIKGLRAMGAVVDFFVPNRIYDGYGLTPALSEKAHQMGAQLLLTVDNGIASIEGVARAKALGLDVLVTDHHLPAATLPDCLIVNPNQPDCSFASKALSGVGVMFYVLMALRATLRQRGAFSGSLKEPNLAELLDLVALGTVADVVPLDFNNRILVSQGLKRIRAGKMSLGVQALFQIARRKAHQAKAFDMGFALVPRINAAGRLDDMSVGIACLLAENSEEADALAAALNTLNHERQGIEQSMLDSVLQSLHTDLSPKQYSLCLYRADFHVGVVGIVASRLKERFYRPTIIFALAKDGLLRGSGRSIAGLHLRDALDLVSKREPDLMETFGGHAMAAGLSIQEQNFTRFQAAFERVLHELIDDEILSRTFLTDGSLPVAELTLDNARLLDKQVWGQGFAAPSFDDEFDVVHQRFLGSEQQHLKAILRRDNREFEAMFWRCTEPLPHRIHLVYRPVVNEYKGQEELQLYADYWQAC